MISFESRVEEVNVFDNMGKRIRGSIKYHDDRASLDLDDHPDGVYLIQIRTTLGSYTEKVIKL